MSKYKVITLGCRTNQYESQAYQKQLGQLGFTPAHEGDASDVCIINTCTVTESADKSSLHAVRKAVRENPGAKIVVTGCSAERNLDKLQAIAGVNHVVINAEKEQLIQKLFPDLETYPEFSIENFESHTRAFVKVQDGCNSFCSYCIIPYVRGRSRSRAMSDVIKEVQELVQQGYREVVLTGINIGDFDGEGNLADLIRQVDNIEGLDRIRVSSIDPDEVDDNLADAILNGKKTCHSMHLVLQSGSNVVLKRMRRKYTRQCFLETAERLRRANPNFTFTTDVIVGFPGETQKDFEETLALIDEMRFAKVHMFPYSDREGTWAQKRYHDKVPPDTIKKRKHILMHASEKGAYNLREEFLGREAWILTENSSPDRPGEIAGHTDNFLKAWVQDSTLVPNQLVKVKLYKNTPEGFLAERIS